MVFGIMKGYLDKTPTRKGLMPGAMLICMRAIPGPYVIFTSMTEPVEFYVSTMIGEIILFPLMRIQVVRSLHRSGISENTRDLQVLFFR
jgi:hypothetical protein